MIDFPYLAGICRSTPSTIVLLVVDGLGGLPDPDTGRSELETARLPNLDGMALASACGLTTPVLPGIAPGSGPGHIALFGYDPVKYLIGRGVLEALGIGVNLAGGDVAVRGNFCTVDTEGLVVDRRAGRVPSETSAALVEALNDVEVPGAEVKVYPGRDYRFVLVLTGDGLGADVSETDPQVLGERPLEATALAPTSQKTARAVNAFVAGAREVLQGHSPANMVLLRGFSLLPDIPSFANSFRLQPAAVAAYPMYRGLAELIGMKVLSTGDTFDDELDTLARHFVEHDFFFLHYKPADAAGEDGDFDAKVARLEELDALIPRLLELGADTLVVAGDHSTPSLLHSHSWHPVPLMIHSPHTSGDGVEGFSERGCRSGALGSIPATSVMALALANAGKLTKFGA